MCVCNPWSESLFLYTLVWVRNSHFRAVFFFNPSEEEGSSNKEQLGIIIQSILALIGVNVI